MPVLASEIIGEAERTVFLELEVVEFFVTLGRIVETGIEEDIGADILAHTQRDGIFPFHQHTLVGGIGIETGAPVHLV